MYQESMSAINSCKYFFQTLLQEILHQQPIVEQVQRTGQKVLENMAPSPERDVLKFRLVDLNKRYPVIACKATARKEQLDRVSPLLDQYHDAVQAFELFLDSAENKLEKLCDMPDESENAVDRKDALQVNVLAFLIY